MRRKIQKILWNCRLHEISQEGFQHPITITWFPIISHVYTVGKFCFYLTHFQVITNNIDVRQKYFQFILEMVVNNFEKMKLFLHYFENNSYCAENCNEWLRVIYMKCPHIMLSDCASDRIFELCLISKYLQSGVLPNPKIKCKLSEKKIFRGPMKK